MTTATAEMSRSVETEEATWRDPKRYAWLLGLLVPLCRSSPGACVELTGLGVFWWLGPLDRLRRHPAARPRRRQGRRTNPPDSVLKWLEEDRYYRWCTYVFIPLQYAGARVRAAGCGRSGDLSLVESSASR